MKLSNKFYLTEIIFLVLGMFSALVIYLSDNRFYEIIGLLMACVSYWGYMNPWDTFFYRKITTLQDRIDDWYIYKIKRPE